MSGLRERCIWQGDLNPIHGGTLLRGTDVKERWPDFRGRGGGAIWQKGLYVKAHGGEGARGRDWSRYEESWLMVSIG